jgi:hypothetical protein
VASDCCLAAAGLNDQEETRVCANDGRLTGQSAVIQPQSAVTKLAPMVAEGARLA